MVFTKLPAFYFNVRFILKQSFKGALQKRYSEKFRKLHWKVSLLVSFFVKLQAWNLMLEGPVQVFYFEFWEISQNSFMQNVCERLFLEVKRCCGKQILQKSKIHHLLPEVTAKALRNTCSGKKFLCFINSILQVI